MTIAVRPTREPPPAKTNPAGAADRFVLHNISWETYESLLRDLAEEHIFLTYDRGTLELISPSPRHDRAGHFLSRLVLAYSEVLDIPIAGFRTTTWRRRDLERGLEADECFYVRNEPAVSGREDVNLERDPPPDLAIEIDITRSTMEKQSIYANLRIPELWRFENEHLSVHVLQPSGSYAEVNQSLSFPQLPLAELERFMHARRDSGETAWIKNFRGWVQQRFVNKDD